MIPAIQAIREKEIYFYVTLIISSTLLTVRQVFPLGLTMDPTL